MSEATRRRVPVIADVARVAGVSVPTVSRVLTGSTPVSPERRERVMRAIAELGYRPNGAARALVQGRQSMIAVFAGNTTRYGYARTIQGIEEAARAAGFIVVITVIETDDPAVVGTGVDLVLGQPVAGAIVLEFDPAGDATVAAMPSSLPLVAATGSSAGSDVPHALMDDVTAAKEATRYLLGLGHRTVHHVAIPPSGRPSGRSVGWREALEEAGIPVPEIQQAGWEPISGYQAGLELARSEDVTAVLCGNDELAIGVMRAMAEQGRRVPEDVSVVGFDGQPLAELVSPPLTTVEQDFVALGRQAFALLKGLIDGKDVPQAVTSAPRLVIRSSTAPAPSRRGE
ncbi:LacI family DNA-binding transcriptional regulator [Actinotalea sp. C106]|uniref:LacI family DNA-binding transcriptional regulator n=1 Tax=Actinotalea sp. C106 TaxID=2908644 RepID=UPI002028F9AF|nr:LacI family DNA-binding transcriptional regulator [Actinotalea sp. C106]